jgi:hypothetical protein
MWSHAHWTLIGEAAVVYWRVCTVASRALWTGNADGEYKRARTVATRAMVIVRDAGGVWIGAAGGDRNFALCLRAQ